MINRYIGSKQQIIDPLLQEIATHADPGDHVVDIFSGSITVALAMKGAGYRVTANDINLFSAVLADAYLVPTDVPTVELDPLLGESASTLLHKADSTLDDLVGDDGFTTLAEPSVRAASRKVAALTEWLNVLSWEDLPAIERRHHFYDTYCEDGRHSAFTSSRGTTGRRRFVTGTNAERLDLVLNQLRTWWSRELLPRSVYSLLLASVMRATEKVANTQGTYHDFPRGTYDPRALGDIRFLPPLIDPLSGPDLRHVAGREEDSLEFIREVEPHSVLYVDPPYNFRQYTAYYFLLNVMCRYPELEDPDEYFGNVRYVRGQNPDDDFSSSFCSVRSFLDSMEALLTRAAAETVVLSYFTGRNHWSDFDSDPDDTGRALLSELLESDIFVPGSLRVTEVDRLNYASYGGYKARRVNELLLTAKKQGAQVEREGSADGRLPTVA